MTGGAPVGPGAGFARRGRARLLAAVVGGAVAVVVAGCGEAQASGAGAPAPVEQPAPAWPDPASTVVTTPQGTGTPVTDGEREMAASMAEQEGQDLERVLARLQHQDDFASFLEEVRQWFPDQFSSAYYGTGQSDPAWVAFTGDVPAEAVPLAEALPIAVELRGDALLAERENNAVSAAGTDAFTADVRPAGGWTAGLDLPTARFTVGYVPDGAKEPDDATTDTIVAAARAALGRDVPFTVEYQPDTTDPSETQPAAWFLPAGFVADPAATSVEVLVDEQGCTSGAGAEGNTAEPVVEIADGEVRIAVSTFVRRGPQACPGHPLAPLVVDLGQPLGDRALVDVHGSIDDELAPRGDVTVPPAAGQP